ncbi:bifunctional DNA primase/polymerase [Mycolicibacterium diernhoferi]|uniref:bifunctional DNA primase/polymerase n=1 Tax=Mycolicibacterium diernhoferi TaxID=1801 RepID=UPI001041E74E|nr:bifunctional DNA primase/polymerase [Mycolicibacterium diernhoferi]QYL21245.1 bifunctional DNA primase/polymerase [Mycolicibacterium diernhoferi]
MADVAAGGVYALGAPKYLAAGWQSPLPVQAGEKEGGLPRDRTGRGKPYATKAEIARWVKERSSDNLALRMMSVTVDGVTYDVIGIDVDDYMSDGKLKEGAKQLRALIKDYGPLPRTWRSTARGADGASGIRFFLAPTGLHWRGKAHKDIDIISPGYRYAVAWPSWNPKAQAQYQWLTADDEVCGIPDPSELPLMPEAWVDFLTNGQMRDEGTDVDVDSSVKEILAWVKERPGYDDEPCDTMQGRGVDYWVRQITEDASSHDKITDAHWALIMLAAEGHRGLGQAVAAVEEHWISDVKARDKRSVRELKGEIFRSSVQALRKLKGQVDSGQLCLTQDDVCAEPEMLAALADPDGWAAKIKREPGHTVFSILTSAQWAEPVPPVRWIIKGTLCEDTFGPNAGPKKSLKTHDNQAIAFACATAQPLYLNPEFAVPKARKVLYIVGEGGELPVRRTLQRMARAYGLNLDKVRRDPDFPLVAAFGAAPMDGDAFVNELKALLDTHQPELVLIESFYNFHPRELETGNLYQRGQAIDEFHKLVRGECAGATSILTDHFRSTGVGKSIDLDNISMAGQAENADSWILRNHREAPDVPAGEFRLRTEFNSRQWGGNAWDVDWHLGRFEPEVGGHDGEISWDVNPASNTANGGSARGPSNNERAALILDYVDTHPEASRTAVVDALAHEHGGRNAFRAEFEKLVGSRLLVEEPFVRDVVRSDGATRPRTDIGWRRGDGKRAVSLREISDADDE